MQGSAGITNKIAVSLIIPVKNIPQELNECLESLKAQTFPSEHFEIIIIDDGSTDSTAEVAENFCRANAHAKLIRRQQSGGPGVARNDGIDLARGKYILFVDGDDFLPPWALESLVEFSTLHDSDAVTFNWSYCQALTEAMITPEKEIKPLRRDLDEIIKDKENLIRRYLSMNCDGSVIYTMTKKDLLTRNAIRFPGGLHEDVEIIFKIYFHSNKTSVLNRVLYLKRNRPGSIVNTLKDAHIRGMFAAWAQLKMFIISQGVNFSDYETDYIKGVLGTIGVVLRRAFETAGIDASERSQLFSRMIEIGREYFPEVLAASDLPNATKYDRFSNLFIHLFSEKENPPQDRIYQIEKTYRELFVNP